MSEYAALKFGGSSVSQPERVAVVFTGDTERNKVAVLSAIGKNPGERNGQLKVTDALINLEIAVDGNDHDAATNAKEFVIERSRECFSSLGNRALQEVCDDAYDLMRTDKRGDGYRWIGEHMSARLFSALTGAVYVPSGLRFSGDVLQLQKSIETIRRTITPHLRSKKQVVTEGYFGFDIMSGRVATLPRGGSDISGVVTTGAMNGVDGKTWVNDNYTEQDGILSADPDIVGEEFAQLISEMTYREAREKMHGIKERNGIVHGNSIRFAAHLGVEMYVRNTFNAASAGTHIKARRDSDPAHPIIGISGKGNIPSINTYDMGMADTVGYLQAILTKVVEREMSISHLPTGEESAGLVFNTETKDEDLEYIRKYIQENAISGEEAEVEVAKNLGIVYLIGQELAVPQIYTRVLGRVANILDANNLAIREVVSHEKSPSLALTVDGNEVENAIRLLHRELIEGNQSA